MSALAPLSGTQLQKTSELLKGRLDDYGREVERLESSKLISADEAKRVRGTFGRSSAVQALYAQAHAIKNIWKDTHHFYLHGQTSDYMPFLYAMKRFAKIKHPELKMKQFVVLRTSQTESGGGSIFKYRIADKIDDTQKDVKKELLSVGANFWDRKGGESAFCWMSANINVHGYYGGILCEHIRELYPKISAEIAKAYAERITMISYAHDEPPCGNLIALCLDKTKYWQQAYPAHPGGEVCRHYEKEEVETLNAWQNDRLDFLSEKEGQYRIFMPAVKPGQNHQIYMLSAVPKEVRKKMKAEVHQIIAEIDQKFGPMSKGLLDTLGQKFQMMFS